MGIASSVQSKHWHIKTKKSYLSNAMVTSPRSPGSILGRNDGARMMIRGGTRGASDEETQLPLRSTANLASFSTLSTTEMHH